MPPSFDSSPDSAPQEYTPPAAANDETYDNVVSFPPPASELQAELVVGETATEDYAASYLPEGAADIAGHGFADAVETTPAPAPLPILTEVVSSSLDLNLDQPAVPDINLNFDGKVDIDPTELGGIQVPDWELVPKEELTPNTPATAQELELVPMEPRLSRDERTPATLVEAKEKIADDIIASFTEKFPGITKEGLESIKGFETLSRGQQKQALENLAQLTVGRIAEEAVEGEAAAYAALQKDASFPKKIWNGLKRSFTKQYDVVKLKKQTALEIQNGDIDTHKAALEQMVTGMKELGPAIKEGEDGTLEMQYVETAGLSPEVAKVAEVFNEQATKFSKIPQDWGGEGATKAQKEAFKEAKDIYELQRGVLMNRMADAGGMENAIKATAKIESQMEMQRFMQTCPDAAKELENIQDQSAFAAALKSVGAERGYYAVGGALVRTATASILGVAAAPLVAMGIAGMRGWKRSGEALLAQDKAQRAGENVSTEKMKAAQERIARITEELGHVDDERVKASLVAELDDLTIAARGTTKNMVTAVGENDVAGNKKAEDLEPGDRRSGATAKIEYLKAQIQSLDAALAQGVDAGKLEEMTAQKTKLSAQLSRRLDYTKMKISDRKVVWGPKDEQLNNQYALTRSMVEAQVLLEGKEVVDEHGDKAERRLGKLLGKTDEEIKSARFKKQATDTILAGTIGGLAAAAGAEMVDAVKWMNGATDTMTEHVLGSAAVVKEHIAAAEESVVHAGKALVGSAEEAAQHAGRTIHSMMPGSAPEVSTEYVDGSRGLSTEQSYIPYGETLRNATEASPDYTVIQGDNLSKIFAREIPGSNNPDVYCALKSMTPEELNKLGVTSGNIDMIHPGDKINVEAMKEYLAAHPSGAAHEVATAATTAEGTHGASTLYENDGTPSSTGIDAHPEHAPGEVALAVSEADPLIPTRKLSELSPDEIDHWPESKASPWPVNEHEADDLFGRVGSGDRKLAENMRAAIGRYPNEEELTGFKSIQNLDTKTGHDMLLAMKKGPQSFDDIKRVVRPVLAQHAGTGTAPSSGVKSYMQGGRRVDVVTTEQAGSRVYHEGKNTDVVFEAKDPANTGAGGASAEQYAKSIEAGKTPIRLADLTPAERVRFGPAIKALTAENGGKFPDGISADEVVKKELDIEAGSSALPTVRRPQVVQASARPDNASINTAARVLGAITGNQQLKDVAGAVANATQPKATGVTAGMMEVGQAMTRGSQSPQTRAIGDAIGQLFKKAA